MTDTCVYIYIYVKKFPSEISCCVCFLQSVISLGYTEQSFGAAESKELNKQPFINTVTETMCSVSKLGAKANRGTVKALFQLLLRYISETTKKVTSTSLSLSLWLHEYI